MLSVYKIDFLMHFDEQSTPLVLTDVLVKVRGPSVIIGERSVSRPKEVWCECMLHNIRSFGEIGYDFRVQIDAVSLALIEEYSKTFGEQGVVSAIRPQC